MFASKDIFLKSSGGGYQISRSVRTRSSATGYFNRSFTTPTSQQKGTFSFWLKRGTLGARNNLFSNDNGTQYGFLEFDANNKLNFADPYSAGACSLITTQVFRDPSAWYHIIIAFDTTQATSTNRAKFYVNGVQITSFDTATYPSQNANLYMLQAGSAVQIAAFTRNGTPTFDGYLTEFNFIDGQQLTPSSFGETNSVTGVWQPKKYGGTYGTNGFYLNFSDNSNNTATTIGKDYSGNGNNWTPNNISVTAGTTYDSMTDVPTLTSATAANYCVLNPLDTASTVTNANLTTSSGAAHQSVRATFQAPSTGLYYMEATILSTTGATVLAGLGLATASVALTGSLASAAANAWFVYFGDQIYVNRNGTGTLFGGTTAAGGVIQLAIDMANSRAWVGLNNTWYDGSNGTTGNPSAGTNPTFTSIASQLFPILQTYSNTLNANFGQRPFSYTPPTGFVALNTQNLPTPTISNGAAYMAATTYTGTGASLTIANTVGSTSFQPDFVWVKGRSGATDHALYDSVRGTTKDLVSNSTAAETTQATGLTAFGSTGFTVGALAKMNTNTATYVGWQWLAGAGSSSSNTSGSITSTVSVNATAGFSVVTYTGTGANATVGHGLGVAPSMVIVKGRTNAVSWAIYQSSLPGVQGQVWIPFDTNAVLTASTVWNNTAPTSSVFSVGTSSNTNASTITYVAYCWSQVAGYSKFGSYTGNGSTDGTFVYTGFRPRFVMIKKTSAAQDWYLYDTARDTYNEAPKTLFPNGSYVEESTRPIDILSNGFKLRISTSVNDSGATYIYATFAENPFKNSLAR